MNSTDPLFTPNPHRFTLFPLKYHKTWQFYKTALSSFWTTESLNLEKDKNHWDHKLTENDKTFIKNVLAFFAASDGIINENLAMKFHNEIQQPEFRAFYTVQMQMETVHSETYSLLIDTYVKNEEKDKLFTAIDNFPFIKLKADWALEWMNSDKSFAERLVAFACVEGIHFSSSFCAIFWLKKRGLMPGLCHSNELISRDENLHCQFAIHVFSLLKDKPSPERVKEIVLSAVSIEKEFVINSLLVDLIGMNSKLMCQYVEYIADTQILFPLIGQKYFNTTQPFEFVTLGLQRETNFFEGKVSEYSQLKDNKKDFDLDANFDN